MRREHLCEDKAKNIEMVIFSGFFTNWSNYTIFHYEFWKQIKK